MTCPDTTFSVTCGCTTTGLSELEGHLLVPYSTKANAFYGLYGSFFPFFFLPNSHCHTQSHLLLLNMVQGDALLVLIDP